MDLWWREGRILVLVEIHGPHIVDAVLDPDLGVFICREVGCKEGYCRHQCCIIPTEQEPEPFLFELQLE